MARHFDGSSDYVDCGTSVRGSDVQRITVAAWIYLDDTSSERTVVGRWDNTTSETWLLSVNSSGNLTFSILDSGFSGHTVTGVTTLTTGQWWHVGGSYDATTLKCYVSGGVDGSSAISVTMHTGTVACLIGQHASGAYMKGSIAEVSVLLDVDNAATIISSLAQGASPSDLEGLSTHDHIGYWPLLGDSPEADLTLNNHQGTVHGTTVVAHPPVRSCVAFKSN